MKYLLTLFVTWLIISTILGIIVTIVYLTIGL